MKLANNALGTKPRLDPQFLEPWSGFISHSDGRSGDGEMGRPPFTPSLFPQLSFRSAALILKSARAPLAQSPLSGRLAVDKGLMLELILLISEVLEASDWEKPRNSGFLQEEGTKIISDLLLVHQTFLSTGNSHPLV